MERAELLCDAEGNNGERRSLLVMSLLVGVVAPMVAVVPFLFALEKDGDDPSRDGLIISSVWLGCVQGYVENICCVCVCVCFFRSELYFTILVLQTSCGIVASRDESCVCKDSGGRTYGQCMCCTIFSRGIVFFLVKIFCWKYRSV